MKRKQTPRMIGLSLIFVLFIGSACEGTEIPVPAETDTPPQTQPVPADGSETPGVHLTGVPLPAGYGAQSPWLDIYFTNPESPLAVQETGGPDGPLVASIDAARLTVDVAMYSVSLPSFRDALIRAHERGVQVRAVMESDNLDRSVPQALIDAGIPILGDRREGLMHDKFIVIDRSEIWTGSMNFTTASTYEDNNNLIHIRSVKVAEDYTKEFEEMFVDDMFGPDVVPETPNPVVTIDGTMLEIFFSPDDGVADKILELLQNAQKSIYFMAYSFTTDEFGDAIRSQAANGLAVEGVMEEDQIKSNIGTEYDPFKQAGLAVYPDGNPGLMHHKVMIIDGEIVLTGSYNFSRSAETRNDENVVIIYDANVADFFTQEFYRVFDQAQK